MIRKRLLLILAGVLIFTFVLAGTAMAVPFVSPFDLVILNGSGAQTANPAARDVTQGENTLPFGMYYYYPGKTIQFRLVGPDNTGVINLGGGPLSPDTNGTLVAGEYTVSADFSSIDGTVSPTISWDGVNGYWSVSYTIPVGWSGTPGGFQIPVTVNFLGGPQPIPVATMVAAMAVDPLEMDDTLKPGTSTDWTAITDFTNITNLTFDKYLTNSYQTSEHLGTLTLGDATHPINLCEMDASGNPTAALALIQLGNNMTIASAKMSINTAVGALAALNKPATLTMYNLPYTSQPGIKYKDNSGTEQVLIAPGDSTDPSNKVSDYSWDGVAKSLTFKASSWSEYDAYIKVAGTASDPTVTMASGSTTVSADNKWTITLTAGTVKTDVTQSDLTITGLPAGLAATASKGTGNTIDITVSGTAASAVTAPATVGVVVKGSAVTETGSLDSNTINVTLNPAPVQVAGTAFDTTVTMVSGNTTVSADNKWTVTVTAGTVKGSATESDLTITGLPAGLTATAAKGTGNTIDITVAGTAASAVNTPVTVSVVVKGSAVTEPGSTDSAAVSVTLNPADTAAPTWTNGSLTESNVGQTSLTLTWSGASDNVGVTDYKIYKNGTLLTNVGNVLTTNITGLTAGTQYTFRVEAGDAANNWSSSGPSKTVTTTSGGGGGGGGGGQQPPPSQPLTTEQANQDAQNQTSNITSQLQTGTLNVTQAVEQVTKVVDTLTRVEVNTETKTQLQQTVSTIVEKAAKVDTAALNIQVTEGKTTVEVTADTITKQVDQVVNTASTLTQKLNEAKMVDVAQTVTRQVVIEVPDTAAREEVRVALPVKAVDTLAAKDVNLVVATKGVTFAVPPAALKVEGAAEDAQVALTTQEVKGAEAEQALKSLAQEPNAEAVAVGKVLEFRATVETATGSSLITGFAKKVIVAIAYDNSKVSNTNKLGVYRYNDATQAWDYVGGKVQADGTIEVSLDHFSKYMVMEFNKTFIDLANHWAKSDVELMAARHVAQGVSATKFGPDASITRAEFAAILVRALGIPQQASEFAVPSYKDVKKSDWFYSSVEAAAKAGLVQRNADGTFAPKARITRQEMAAMVAQAMKAAGKEAALTAGEVASILGEFADQGEIAAWAQEAAAVAAKEGIISGRGNGMYAPKANATRAEGFAMVRRLLANVGLI